MTVVAEQGQARPRWLLFALLALGVVAADQVTKSLVVGALALGERVQVVGDYVRIVHSRNDGILFGLLPESAPIFAAVSIFVLGLIVYYHSRSGRSLLTTVALGLLLGGAIGNLLDRLRLGSVVDFVDVGIGALRFYTFNVADAAISTAILFLIALAVVPKLGDIGAGG